MGDYPLSRFVDSLQRMVKDQRVFKHRPLNGVTFTPLFKGNVQRIDIRRTEGEISGFVKLKKHQIKVTVDDQKVIFDGVRSFHVDDKAGIVHFLTEINSTI